MTDVFLGIIAFAVLVMAAIQVAAIVFAARAARRVGEAVNDVGEAVRRLESDVRPIVANLQQMTADAVRTASSVAHQAERAERVLGEFSTRVDDTLASLRHTIMAPARDGLAILHGIKAALAALRATDRSRNRGAHAEEEDALFIG